MSAAEGIEPIAIRFRAQRLTAEQYASVLKQITHSDVNNPHIRDNAGLAGLPKTMLQSQRGDLSYACQPTV